MYLLTKGSRKEKGKGCCLFKIVHSWDHCPRASSETRGRTPGEKRDPLFVCPETGRGQAQGLEKSSKRKGDDP